MIDGVYQSVIVFFMTYLLFAPATFNSDDGRGIDDAKRMGIYIGTSAVFVANFYILFNTYRWDWLMLLIVAISTLLVWFWTGVYTAFTDGASFYGAAPQVYGQLSFWVVLLLAVVICLLPRFAGKSFQKLYMPRDVDIIREQIRQGKFDYLKEVADDSFVTPSPEKVSTFSSSDDQETKQHPHHQHKQSEAANTVSEDMRPIYPPSVAPTGTTYTNPHSHNGSNSTDYTNHRSSFDRFGSPVRDNRTDVQRPSLDKPRGSLELSKSRVSMDRPRPSFDRVRGSMDQLRPSFEASHDMTSAARLMRMESSQSAGRQTPQRERRLEDLTDDLGR